MVNGGQRNLGMAFGAGLLWLADSMLQVPILIKTTVVLPSDLRIWLSCTKRILCAQLYKLSRCIKHHLSITTKLRMNVVIHQTALAGVLEEWTQLWGR